MSCHAGRRGWETYRSLFWEPKSSNSKWRKLFGDFHLGRDAGR
jgi:hypothetical protein